MPVTVVYIYGPAGCGKTTMLEDVAGKIMFDTGIVLDGVCIAGGRNFTIFDSFCSSMTAGVLSYIQSVAKMDHFVILCSNEQPDNINLHFDHIFDVGTAHNMDEARAFLESVLL